MRSVQAILLAISVATATPSLAQATPEALANDVLMAYKQGDTDEFSKLVTASPLLNNTPTLAAQIKSNLATLLDLYGPVEGWDLVRTKSASQRYVEKSYIIYQNEYATRLQLTFYKKSSGWIITSFKIDDSIDTLLESTD
ncbi:hypothetical protein [Parasphingorhabdus sp.]|uniref:hypothetical protein n=1 Tax=Parasphingorhabdus sp. TaxID=2709688 RepID=UPI003A8E635A